MDLIHRSHDLSKEIGKYIFYHFKDFKNFFRRSFRDNSRPLQCRSWKDRDLHCGVQALAGLPQPGGHQAVHHGHCGDDEEAALPDGPEEGAIHLYCQMSQVSA